MASTSSEAAAAAAVPVVPPKTGDTKKRWSSIFSSSCAASFLMVGYILMAFFNIYGLMFPLTFVKLEDYGPQDSWIHPLWETEAKMAMKVYLSTKQRFDKEFLRADLPERNNNNNHNLNEEEDTTDPNQKSKPSNLDTVLLWQDTINRASMTKSFLLSTWDCIKDGQDTCTEEQSDASLTYARNWLNHQEHLLKEDDGSILSTIQSAGQGIETTSVLLTFYNGIAKRLRLLLKAAGFGSNSDDDDDADDAIVAAHKGILNRTLVHLSPTSPLWSALQQNTTVYLHVAVMRQQYFVEQPETFNQAALALGQASRMNSLLFGQVDLVKYDEPNHLTKPARILYHDVTYLVRKYLLQQSVGRPPWDMQVAKPEYYQAYEAAQQMKLDGAGYPYWKPEVTIKYLIDDDSYPAALAHVSGMELVRVPQKTKTHPTGLAFLPVLHVDEIGMTSDKYIPINETVSTLPLRISFDRSDMKDEHHVHATTATAGGISPARWRLLSHLSKSLDSQRELGFEQSDIDDLRRLIADTNVTLLGITVLASALHLLFEFLTFKNEVSFWQNNSDLTGLSVRSLFLDMIGQFIIVLYLIDRDSSLLMTIPSAIGVLIALWKCQRAAGFAFVPLSPEDRKLAPSFWNIVPRMFGYKLTAKRLQTTSSSSPTDDKASSSSNQNSGPATTKIDLQALTIEADRQATSRLGSILLPLVLGYTMYSLVMEERVSWYSWLITSASSAVYAFGFVLMTPQLFLNYKLKSVAHLPWRVLVYKSLNTFIDDLFSFIIRMPTMARISCFRDDVVFFIYLYQRWLYPVDTSRPVEGGGDGTSTTEPTTSRDEAALETKKKQ
ncbi:Cleft lip and palate transmembrane protein 1 (CLPTM1)-domain containing protein [Nitzschia inconspicua]|uniref:Cleft lip and palate transmembrane protein 1 (CLPTM1)-domain containing protein n=1 Tax=Nitzschia inconspicua TaxID=303405 RepID=A0A9K3KK50_9STRA|nr:Cleft lip and palate transmembrane protein 1 (CLPTM1)-domain containing protein [Nitzschia inconspicua]